MSTFSIDPATSIGAVSLTVASLERSEQFYRDVLGFRTLERNGDALALTADGTRPLVVLHQVPGAKPKPRRATGLYHFAVLVPNRLELARSLRNLAEKQYPLTGASDHLVSEALYLDDPDGNGIEIYRDRPRSEWPRVNGELKMAVDPLDADGIINELASDDRAWDGLHPDTTLGHMHLHVADLRAAKAFYCDVLGFELITSMQSALFVSAGGYHHHLGLNTWAGVGAPPAPEGSAGLRQFDVRLPNADALEAVLERIRAADIAVDETTSGWLVRDPSQNAVILTVG